MTQRVEESILLAIAIVTAAAAFGLDPVFAGLMLAGLNVALALCAGSRLNAARRRTVPRRLRGIKRGSHRQA